MAQVLTTDMLLTATITVAFFAFFLHWREGGRWCWLMYVAMAFGTLTKGPVAIAIPLVVGAVFLVWENDWRGALARFHLIPGLILTAAICAPWFIAISIRQPDFLDFYIIGEYFRRAFDATYSHGEPFYYYLPAIIAGTLPWSIVVLLIPWRSFEPRPVRRFCIIAVGAVLVIFSLASAKLIPYILPAWAPLAVVLGDGIASLTEMDPRRRNLTAFGLLLIIAGAGLITIALFAARFSSPYPLLVWPAIAIAGVILIVGGAGAALFFWHTQVLAGFITIAVAASAIYLTVSYGRLMAESTRSYARLARQIEQRAPAATLICYPRYIQSLPFYCHRRVILIGPETELAYGAEHSPDASSFFFKHKADLLRLWAAPDSPVLVLDRSALPSLKDNLGKFDLIAEDRKKIAIRRAASSRTGAPRSGQDE